MDKLDTDTIRNGSAFALLYQQASTILGEKMGEMGITSGDDLYSRMTFAKGTPQGRSLEQLYHMQSKVNDILATMVAVAARVNGKSIEEYLVKSVYETAKNSFDNSKFVMVNQFGMKLENPIGKVPQFFPNSLEGMIRMAKMWGESGQKAAIAKEILSGNVYLMDKFLAEHMDKEYFSHRVDPSIISVIKKSSRAVISLIMAVPTEIINRLFNFTVWDMGTLTKADPGANLHFVPAYNSIRQLIAMRDSLTSLDTLPEKEQKYIHYLLQYMDASNLAHKKTGVFLGEGITPPALPILKGYLDKVAEAFGQQHLVTRLSYFCSLMEAAKQNNGMIPARKSGAAYVKLEGINQIKGQTDEESMALRASQVIAENIGSFGNMPYLATAASKLGFMFTTFPLAQVRYGFNKVSSLWTATQRVASKDSEALEYLLHQTGNMALSAALLLAIKALLSPALRRALKGLFDDDVELSEEEEAIIETLIFRGGAVKPLQSMIGSREIVTSYTSQDATWGLINSFVYPFVDAAKTQEDDDPENDKSSLEAAWSIFQSQIWSHVPALVKDPIESVPGNKILQSNDWHIFQERSFFENLTRKLVGYTVGLSVSNAFFDSMDATQYEEDTTFWDRMGEGFGKATEAAISNTTQAKSEYRNYRKAFNTLYTYTNTRQFQSTAPFDKEAYGELRPELLNALKNNTSPAAFYNIIAKYRNEHVNTYTLRSAVNSLCLRHKLEQLPDLEQFINSLSDGEASSIKQALAYEDEMFPYLTDASRELHAEYQRERAQQYQGYSIGSTARMLNAYKYNTRRAYQSSYQSPQYSKSPSLPNHRDVNQAYAPMSTYNYMQNKLKDKWY